MCGNHDHHEHAAIELPDSMMTRRSALRLGGMGLGAVLLAACGANRAANVVSTTSSSLTPTTLAGASSSASEVAAITVPDAFAAFADTVKVVRDGKWWMVESDGLPAHNMMVGITSWQQQVPTAQPYVGANAWSIPVTPVISKSPVSAKTSLYRGAIALAVNGVPIFNALNNRGDDAFLFGELDKWGGHAGRADDYHYHVAPLHLQKQAGANMPIAYALDGFPIYGETEPDGSAVDTLDEFNGHYAADGSYHYHGTRTYPYINGGLRGVITVSGDQIDPQPTTRPFREALTPLNGAVITSFETPATGSYRLGYSINNATAEVAYVVTDSSVAFTFTDASGATRRETYTRN